MERTGTPDELDPQEGGGYVCPFFPHLPYTCTHITGSPQEAPGATSDAIVLQFCQARLLRFVPGSAESPTRVAGPVGGPALSLATLPAACRFRKKLNVSNNS